jgi:hypothetical protein
MKLSVVVPVFNEKNIIRSLLSAEIREEGISNPSAETLHRMGILRWFLNGKILRRRGLPMRQLRVYDLWVPLFRVERFFPIPLGTSLIAVAEKSG